MSGSPKYSSVSLSEMRAAQLERERRERERQRQAELARAQAERERRERKAAQDRLSARLGAQELELAAVPVDLQEPAVAAIAAARSGVSNIIDAAGLDRARQLVADANAALAGARLETAAREADQSVRVSSLTATLGQLDTAFSDAVDPRGLATTRRLITDLAPNGSDPAAFEAAAAAAAKALASHVETVRLARPALEQEMHAISAETASVRDHVAAMVAELDGFPAELEQAEAITRRLAQVSEAISRHQASLASDTLRRVMAEVNALSERATLLSQRMEERAIEIEALFASLAALNLTVDQASTTVGADGSVSFAAVHREGWTMAASVGPQGDPAGPDQIVYEVDDDLRHATVGSGGAAELTCDRAEDLILELHNKMAAQGVAASDPTWAGKPDPLPRGGSRFEQEEGRQYGR